MITLVSKWKLRNGCTGELLEGLKKATRAVQAGEPGTWMYSVHLPALAPLDDNNQPVHPQPEIALADMSEIVFIEIYRDAKAFENHLGGPAFQGFKDRYLKYFYTQPGKPQMPMVETGFLERQAAFIRPSAGGLDSA